MIYQQMSIFDDVIERYKITKPIRLIEFFSGIGSQAKALEILGVSFEHYKTCEWAYNSYCAYNSIHIKDTTDYSKDLTKEELVKLVNGTSMNYNEPLTLDQLNKKPIEWLRNAYNNIKATNNLVNIMDVEGKDLEIVNTDKYEYILTYSFPCQDLSLAGKRAGMSVSQADGGTRSGLLWEVERILQECKDINQLPQILIMENVPEVCGKNNVRDFEKWQMRLNELGYTNYCEILNAKDYGIPQNRKRCFMVSILGEYNYTFPKKMHLKYRLKDLLEKNVDEKYFLSQKFLNYITHNSSENFNRKEQFERNLENVEQNGITTTLTTKQGRGCMDTFVGVYDWKESDTFRPTEESRVHIGSKVSKTITTRTDSCCVITASSIAIKNNNSKGYEDAKVGDGIDISTRMHHHRGTVQHESAQTITCMGGENVGVVVSNLKQELCDKLIEEGKVQDGDIVNHSYSNSRLSDSRKAVERQNEMPALTTRPDTLGVAIKEQSLRIRKLTPTECMKLMGFTEKDTNALREIGSSDAAIYHCCGDSIVVTVLVSIFSNLLNNLNTHEFIINKYVEENILK